MGSWVTHVLGLLPANFQLATPILLDLGSCAGQTDRQTDRQRPSTHYAATLGGGGGGGGAQKRKLRWSSRLLRHPAWKMITISVHFIVYGTPRVFG